MAERPFTDTEVRILRGMAWEYEESAKRRQRFWHRLSILERVLIVFIGLWQILWPVAALIIAGKL